MDKQSGLLRETDNQARILAKELIRTARFGALAVLSQDDNFPLASRVLVATDQTGAPIILVSTLALHTKALMSNGNSSILLGEPSKGDPLAYSRISIKCAATPINDLEKTVLRARFINRHPKASLYVDFPDFSFFRLNPIAANLNGGFGKAFELEPTDILIDNSVTRQLAKVEASVLRQMNEDHSDLIHKLACHKSKNTEVGWKLISVDCEGVELAKADSIKRLWFNKELNSADNLKDAIFGLGREVECK